MSGEEPSAIDARSGLSGVRFGGGSLFPSINNEQLRQLLPSYREDGNLFIPPKDEASFFGTFKGTFYTGTSGSIFSGVRHFINDAFIYKADGTDPNSVLSEEERLSGYFNGANSVEHVQYLREQRYNVLNHTSEAGKAFSSWGSFSGGFLAAALDPADWALYSVGFALARIAITAANPALGFAITAGTAAPALTNILKRLIGTGFSATTRASGGNALSKLYSIPIALLERYEKRNALKYRVTSRVTEAVTGIVIAEGAGATIRGGLRSDLDFVDGLIDTVAATALGTIFTGLGTILTGRTIDVQRRLNDRTGLLVPSTELKEEASNALYSGNMQIDSESRIAYYDDGGATLNKSEGFDEDSMRPLGSPVADPVRQMDVEERISAVDSYVTVPKNAFKRVRRDADIGDAPAPNTRRIDVSFNDAYRDFLNEASIELRRTGAYKEADINDLLEGVTEESSENIRGSVVSTEEELRRAAYRTIANRQLGSSLEEGDLGEEIGQLAKQLSAMSWDGAFRVTKPDRDNPILGITFTNTPFRAGNIRVVTMRQYIALIYSGRLNGTDINKLIVVGRGNRGGRERKNVLRFDSVKNLNNSLRKRIMAAPFTYTSLGYDRSGNTVIDLPGADSSLDKGGQLLVVTGDNGVQYGIFPQFYRFPKGFNKLNENYSFPIGGMTVTVVTREIDEKVFIEYVGDYNRNETAQISNVGDLQTPENTTTISLFNSPVNNIGNHEITIKTGNIVRSGNNPWTQGITRSVLLDFRLAYENSSKYNKEISVDAKNVLDVASRRSYVSDITDDLGINEVSEIATSLNNEVPSESVDLLIRFIRDASVREGSPLGIDEVINLLDPESVKAVPRIFRELLKNGIDIRNFTVEGFLLIDRYKNYGFSIDELLTKVQRLEEYMSLGVVNNQAGGNVVYTTAVGLSNYVRTIGLGDGFAINNIYNSISSPAVSLSDHAIRVLQHKTGDANVMSIQGKVRNVSERYTKESEILYKQASSSIDGSADDYNIKLNRALYSDKILSELEVSGDVNSVQYVRFIRDGIKNIDGIIPKTDLDYNRVSFRAEALSMAIRNENLSRIANQFARGIGARDNVDDIAGFASKWVLNIESQTTVPHLDEFVRYLRNNLPEIYENTFYMRPPHEFLSEESQRLTTVSLMRVMTGARGRSEYISDWEYIMDRHNVSLEQKRTTVINAVLGVTGANTTSSVERMVNAGYVRPALNVIGSTTRLVLSFGGVYDVTTLQRMLSQNKIFSTSLVNFSRDFGRRLRRSLDVRNTTNENVNKLQTGIQMARGFLLSGTDESTVGSLIQSSQGVGLLHASGSNIGSTESVGSTRIAKYSNFVNNFSSIRSATTGLNYAIRTSIPPIIANNLLLARDSVEDFIRVRGLRATSGNIDNFFNDQSSVRWFTDIISGKELGVFLNESGLGLREAIDIINELENVKGIRLNEVDDVLNLGIEDAQLSDALKRRLQTVNFELESNATTTLNSGEIPALFHGIPLLRQVFLQFISYVFSAQARRFVSTAANPNVFYNLFWIQAAASMTQGLQVLKINREEDEEKRKRKLRAYNDTNPLFNALKHYGSVADLGLLGFISGELARLGTKPSNFGSNIPFTPPIIGTIDDAFGIFAGLGNNRTYKGFFESVSYNAKRVADKYLLNETALGLIIPNVKTMSDAFDSFDSLLGSDDEDQ